MSNIKKNIEPLLHSLSKDNEINNDRNYYFNKIQRQVKKVVELSEMLILLMKERKIEERKIDYLSELSDSLQKYLISEIKFNPPFIYDKLVQMDSLLDLLKKETIPKELCKSIQSEVRNIYLLIGEYFLKEARRLLIYSIEKTELVLDNLKKGIKPEKEYLPINIIDIINQAIQNEMISSNLKKIEFRKKFNFDECFIYGYRPDLIRAFSNIINNAIKYNDSLEKYDVWVEVDIRNLNSKVEIEFENWGVGIEKEEIEKEYIFQNGYRGKQPLHRNIPGKGLGLYDAKKAIEGSGGSIKVLSNKVRINSDKYITKVIVTLNAYSAYKKINDI